MTSMNKSFADHSGKSVLARSCDLTASLRFANFVSPLIGNAKYVAATSDDDFILKLNSHKWSVVFFAPGACRLSAVNRQIPGSNDNTKGWTIEQYKNHVIKLQGSSVQIVESIDERETINLINSALETAREINTST